MNNNHINHIINQFYENLDGELLTNILHDMKHDLPFKIDYYDNQRFQFNLYQLCDINIVHMKFHIRNKNYQYHYKINLKEKKIYHYYYTINRFNSDNNYFDLSGMAEDGTIIGIVIPDYSNKERVNDAKLNIVNKNLRSRKFEKIKSWNTG